jgi:hypothetical protein
VSGGLVGEPQTLTVLGDGRVRNQLGAATSLTAQFSNGVNITGRIAGEVLSGIQAGEALLRVGYDF